MGLRCFFGHKWKIISIFNYWDCSFDQRAASHSCTLRCENCGKLKVQENYCGGFIYLGNDDTSS